MGDLALFVAYFGREMRYRRFGAFVAEFFREFMCGFEYGRFGAICLLVWERF